MKTFHIFNKELEIKSSLIIFAILRENIESFAVKAAEEFDTFYGKCPTLKYFLENAETKACDLFKKYQEETVSLLIKLNIYDISVAEIQSKKRTYNFSEIYETLSDWYVNQLQNEAQKDQYRTLRRKSRSRWVGGGFGLNGAVSGAVQAGLLNMASGTIHGAVNAVGKGISTLGAAVSENTMFHNADLRKAFSQSVNEDVYQILDVVSEILDDSYVDFISITPKDTAKADSLFENLTSKSLTEEQQYDIAYRLFLLDPFKIKYYKYCVLKYPSQQKELISLGKYCKLKMDDCILSIFENIFNSMPHDTEENTLVLYDKLKEKQKELETETNDIIQKTEKLLHDFDVAARTFKNVTYDTREIRAKAEQDYNTLQKLCADIASADETECNRKNAVIAENDFLSDILEPFQNKIKNRIEEIWSAEDGQIFDNILINTDISNTQAISDSIAYIEESGRTEHKNRYIEALKNFTPQNIALTKKYIAWKNTHFIKKYYFQLIFCIGGFLIMFNASTDSFLCTLGKYILLTGIIYIVFSTVRTSKRKKAWKLLTVEGEVLHPILTEESDKSGISPKAS